MLQSPSWTYLGVQKLVLHPGQNKVTRWHKCNFNEPFNVSTVEISQISRTDSLLRAESVLCPYAVNFNDSSYQLSGLPKGRPGGKRGQRAGDQQGLWPVMYLHPEKDWEAKKLVFISFSHVLGARNCHSAEGPQFSLGGPACSGICNIIELACSFSCQSLDHTRRSLSVSWDLFFGDCLIIHFVFVDKLLCYCQGYVQTH